MSVAYVDRNEHGGGILIFLHSDLLVMWLVLTDIWILFIHDNIVLFYDVHLSVLLHKKCDAYFLINGISIF